MDGWMVGRDGGRDERREGGKEGRKMDTGVKDW